MGSIRTALLGRYGLSFAFEQFRVSEVGKQISIMVGIGTVLESFVFNWTEVSIRGYAN